LKNPKLQHSAFLNLIPLSLRFEKKHKHYSRLF
jgi:5-hydroxyisourate hydrolase-like protein (transthyretin family)